MINRQDGGRDGFKEYFRHGRKAGRKPTREQLDKRVVLDGNIELTDRIVQSMPGQGERYLHWTSSFAEDYIPIDVMNRIARATKKILFTAYRPDEFNVYIEAHLPRIRSYVNALTGELVERKPHFHMIVPKINLLTGGYLNPLGWHARSMAYLDALQECINVECGLASPKIHRSMVIMPGVERYSRHGSDLLVEGIHEFKEEVLQKILSEKVNSLDQFSGVLGSYGSVSQKKRRWSGDYLCLRRSGNGADDTVNFHEYVFSSEFLGLPLERKMAMLGPKLPRYIEAQPGYLASLDSASPIVKQHLLRKGKLADWVDFGADEAKYLNSGARQQWRLYHGLKELQEHREWLKNRADKFYARAWPLQLLKEKPVEVERARQERLSNQVAQVAQLDHAGRLGQADPAGQPVRATRPCHDSLIGQYLSDQQEQVEAARCRQRLLDMSTDLSAERFLLEVSASHGLIPGKYSIGQDKNGQAVIRCGRRALLPVDFLIQEMNLPVVQAEELLVEVLARQRQQLPLPAAPVPADPSWWRAWRKHGGDQVMAESDDPRRAGLRRGYQAYLHGLAERDQPGALAELRRVFGRRFVTWQPGALVLDVGSAGDGSTWVSADASQARVAPSSARAVLLEHGLDPRLSLEGVLAGVLGGEEVLSDHGQCIEVMGVDRPEVLDAALDLWRCGEADPNRPLRVWGAPATVDCLVEQVVERGLEVRFEDDRLARQVAQARRVASAMTPEQVVQIESILRGLVRGLASDLEHGRVGPARGFRDDGGVWLSLPVGVRAVMADLWSPVHDDLADEEALVSACLEQLQGQPDEVAALLAWRAPVDTPMTTSAAVMDSIQGEDPDAEGGAATAQDSPAWSADPDLLALLDEVDQYGLEMLDNGPPWVVGGRLLDHWYHHGAGPGANPEQVRLMSRIHQVLEAVLVCALARDDRSSSFNDFDFDELREYEAILAWRIEDLQAGQPHLPVTSAGMRPDPGHVKGELDDLEFRRARVGDSLALRDTWRDD